jgi:hypothetical protein
LPAFSTVQSGQTDSRVLDSRALDEEALVEFPGAAAVADAHRDGERPALRRRARQAEAALLQPQVGAARVAGDLATHQRHAGAVDERGEHRLHVAVGGALHRGEELVGVGDAVDVGAQVGAHRLAKAIGPDPALDHRQHHVPLVVGDAIEDVGETEAVHHPPADRLGAGREVGAHRRDAGVDAVGRLQQRRLELAHRLLGDPLGEALVEPQIVPPRGSHQVAEPVVRDLVHRDVGRRRAEAHAEPGVRQHMLHARGDEAGVLHRAVGHQRRDGGDQIELGVRVRHVEVGLEPLDCAPHHARDVGAVRRLASRDEEAHRDLPASGAAAVDDVEPADGERDEVRGQRAGRREAHHAQPALAALGGDRRVRGGQLVLGDPQGDRPRRLEAGLVEAGEGLPRVGRLEVGVEVGLAVERAGEDAGAAPLVDGAAVGDDHGRRARPDGGVDVEPEPARCDRARLRRAPATVTSVTSRRSP